MKIDFKNFKFIYLFLLIVIFISLGGAIYFYVGAEGLYNTGFRVDDEATSNVTLYDGVTCQEITNLSGKDLFIPTKSSEEWDAFVANKPDGVTIESCCDPVNGGWTSYGSCTSCSASCGGGTQTCYRTCTNPAPSCGGLDCVGSTSGVFSCNTQNCPTSCGANISTGMKCTGLLEYDGSNTTSDDGCRATCGAVGAWCWGRDEIWGCYCSFTSRDFTSPAGTSHNGLCY